MLLVIGYLTQTMKEHSYLIGHHCTCSVFRVRRPTYLRDRVKLPSAPAEFACRGVEVCRTEKPERHISPHPAVLGGRLGDEDTSVVNFLLPFANFVSYFAIPPLDTFPPNVARVWPGFLCGNHQYRNARLKMLTVVDRVEGRRGLFGPGAAGEGNTPPVLLHPTDRGEKGDLRGGCHHIGE